MIAAAAATVARVIASPLGCSGMPSEDTRARARYVTERLTVQISPMPVVAIARPDGSEGSDWARVHGNRGPVEAALQCPVLVGGKITRHERKPLALGPLVFGPRPSALGRQAGR